ncbi:MAG: DUF2218 domain-containing protein [Rothia sp. (in: high G+C Gram-positive bacteria)]|nr:DUF2218 domain-containing protein [Rothia sp. (in: high G+C Gram-positive bacteria)]
MVTSQYPAIETLTLRSRAVVETDRPARYAKQLASHFGHKITVEEIESGHRLITGTATLAAQPAP